MPKLLKVKPLKEVLLRIKSSVSIIIRMGQFHHQNKIIENDFNHSAKVAF